jgi:ABC-type Fe3+-hydroxamate transport system substrate-binding protein
VRIVSLLPSATEIVCALGAGGDPLGVAAGERAPTLDLLPEVLPWDDWPVVRSGRVCVADGNAGLGVHPVRP